MTETANDIDRNEPSHPSTIEETLQLLRQGRRDLIPHLRWQLKQVPDLWSHAGDLGRLTQSALARAIAGDNDLVRESIMLVADRDRQDLAGDGGSATQRLLAERVVLSRMQLANYVQMEAQNSVALLGTRLGAAVSKRLQSGERQLRESIRQLEIARRLESEIRPRRPAASLKIYDPARIKKTA